MNEYIENNIDSNLTNDNNISLENKDNKLFNMSDEFNYQDFMMKDIDEVTNKIPTILNQNKKKRDYNTDICKISVDINKNISIMNEENKADILRLGDLLELFQGPIPIKDRMIIATTNNFEKIKEILPALIRPGRLTPIEFNYMPWNVLNELCQYYFKDTIKCSEFKINIPTSQIVELVHKILTSNLSISDFENELKKECKY